MSTLLSLFMWIAVSLGLVETDICHAPPPPSDTPAQSSIVELDHSCAVSNIYNGF